MAKLYFQYSTMNAGKSTVLLQASHNYRERGMETYLLTANLDDRAGQGRIASRIGIGEAADTFLPDTDMFAMIDARLAQGKVACVFIDEAQFLSKDQVCLDPQIGGLHIVDAHQNAAEQLGLDGLREVAVISTKVDLAVDPVGGDPVIGIKGQFSQRGQIAAMMIG